jgi:ATP-dependent DNA helicase RecQ
MSTMMVTGEAAGMAARDWGNDFGDKSGELLAALRRYWGYESFRPRQEEIVRSIAAGRDACVVMPTGGGKSLCYQLPAALAAGRTAVVVSPLIALMQDQVAQLQQMGIPAVFLNSAVAQTARGDLKRRTTAGEFRLLYLSPERLALDSAAEWLKEVPLSFFAIDEAHCISEWGHDFRPEYRQLSRLRKLFPELPIAAFTASATQRVRHDIIEQLGLRDPYKHIASFRRENLRYIVQQCSGATQDKLLIEAVRRVRDGNVIVYAPTIARVGEVVDLLEENGIAAVGYHGQMENAVRRDNQEKWMSEEVRVLVGTIAFGLGINKASVRSVIHLALPKGVEQYYQEAGRAGRDGLPADCIMLWQKKDTGLHAFFIGKIEDAEEKERAWQRYHDIQRFVDSPECRQLQVCRYFGEMPKWERCGECDVCRGVPDWLKVAAEEGRRTSRRTRSGARGVRSSEGARETFALDRDAPYMSKFARPERTGGGEERSEFEELYEYMRQWRRDTAKKNDVAAFVVLFDSSLDALCRARPSTLNELRRVSGFGEKKLEAYGQQVLDSLQRFREGARAQDDWRAKPSQPAQETLQLLRQGHTFEEIAQIRGRKMRGVVALVAELIERGDTEFRPDWMAPARYDEIAAVCRQLGVDRLRPIKDALPAEVTYEEIKLVAANLRRQAPPPPPPAIS